MTLLDKEPEKDILRNKAIEQSVCFNFPTLFLENLHHPLNISLFHFFMVDDGKWIIFSNSTICVLLDFERSFPWLIDIFAWHISQYRKKVSNIIALRIVFFGKRNGRINSKISRKEGRTRQPHPIRGIDTPISVY